MSRRKRELKRLANYLTKRAEDIALLSKNTEVTAGGSKYLREKSAFYSGFAKGLEQSAYWLRLRADEDGR